MANQARASCLFGIAVAFAGCSRPIEREGGGGGGGDTDVDGGASGDVSGSGSDAGSGSTHLDCAMRPPPAGWAQLTSGRIQDTDDIGLFDIADSTKYLNMFGFNDRLAPTSGPTISAPYVEVEGPPPPIDHPVWPARPATNAMYGYGAEKEYYALEFTVPTFPDASGATSIVEYMTGSSSNHGTDSTLSISQCPGDFSEDLGSCLDEKFFGEAASFGAEAGAAADSQVGMDTHLCHLTPGASYWLNMAPSYKGDWTQSSCTTSQWCWTTLIIDVDTCPGAPDNDCNALINGM